MSEFLNNLTTYQIAAFMAAFLLVGIPMLGIAFKALGEWLYKKMRGWL